jgi:glucose-1-phosphate adenylyltransferase
MGYVLVGYCVDIGTINRLYHVNLDMANADPPFVFYSPQRPIYSLARFLPASVLHGCQVNGAIVTDGCRLYDSTITGCVIGLRSIIGPKAAITASVIMGADHYETQRDVAENKRIGQPNIGIGEGTVIERAIVDKNARIGRNVTIRAIPERPDEDSENDNWVAREGIVIVPKNAIIPDNTVI